MTIGKYHILELVVQLVPALFVFGQAVVDFLLNFFQFLDEFVNLHFAFKDHFENERKGDNDEADNDEFHIFDPLFFEFDMYRVVMYGKDYANTDILFG